MIILPDGEEAHSIASQCVKTGGIIAFRTDTFYGLGVDPFKGAALRALKDLKGREASKPILVVIGDSRIIGRFFANKSRLCEALSEKHWPGPLTLISRAQSGVPDELTSGTQTIGVRLPGDENVRALINACGGALTATSANPSGALPARTAVEVANYFPEGVALIVDGGTSRTDRPSTIVDVTGDDARLIREGVITRAEISQTLLDIGATLVV